MRKTAFLVLLLAGNATSSPAAGVWKKIRRIATVTACASSAVDFASTRAAVSRGAVERNPVMGSGTSWQAGVLKAGVCGGMWAMGERVKGADKPLAVTAIAATGLFTFAAVHNQRQGTK